MKKIMAILCASLMLVGCQQASQQQSPENSQRQDAAKKLFAQGILLLQQKNLKGSIESLEASIKLDPSDPNPYLLLGQILIKSDQSTQAVEFLDQTAKIFPDNGAVFYMLSVANKMAGNKLPAVLAARRSYEIFNAASDTNNAQASAILLEELIKEAQATEKTTTSTKTAPVQKANEILKK